MATTTSTTSAAVQSAQTNVLPAHPALRRSVPPISDVGITEVYCPASGVDVLADVVFVHGLRGHPMKTWLYGKQSGMQSAPVVEKKAQHRSVWRRVLHRGSSEKTPSAQPVDQATVADDKAESCYWPYHLLPEALPEIRVLTYGYDSHPTHFYKGPTNRMTITQHADDLMHKVAGVRSLCRGRPLIFVAHSLGGILVKGALCESQQMTYQPAYADLKQSCCAIVFMGTPHMGADIAAWGMMVSNIVGALPGGFTTYSGVLRGLAPDSETLYTISRRFNELLNDPIPPQDKIQICSVQEGMGMSSAKGGGSKVVPDYSSKFNRTDIEQSFFNQTANHMNMCRFSSADDQAWKDVLRVLETYCLTIRSREVAIRKKQEAHEPSEASGS